jgi:excisionase family DNA binding protein
MTAERDLTVTETAEMLRLHPETIRVWLRQGHFPHAYQFGRRGGWRIPLQDVEAVKNSGGRTGISGLRERESRAGRRER